MSKQMTFTFPEPLVREGAKSWGGRRRGAGAKAKASGVRHVSRERVTRHQPRLVTVKCGKGLECLRTAVAGTVLVEYFRAAQRPDFRIVHFTIQNDHLHFLIEADDSVSFECGMKGLVCRMAKGLNRAWQRRGPVFPTRYHDLVLTTLRQVRNALKYVLNNHRKHFANMPSDRVDLFSSAAYFDGWSDHPREADPREPDSYVAAPGWMIAVGWKQHYPLIALAETPAATLRPT